MNEAILFCGALLFGFAFRVIGRKLDDKKLHIKGKELAAGQTFFRVLSVALFFLYMPTLFMRESIATQIGLTPEAGESAATTAARMPFTPTVTVLLVVLKWLTILTVAVLVTLPFFDKKEADDYASFFAPIVVVLNCVFFRQIAETILYASPEVAAGASFSQYYISKNPIEALSKVASYAIANGDPYLHWRIVCYACVIALMGAISFERLIRTIMTRDFKGIGKRLGKMGLYILFYLFAFMPMYAPQLLFGSVGSEPAGFTLSHRLVIYFTFAFPLAVQFLFQKRSLSERRYVLIMLALSGFFSYFSQYIYPDKSFISTLPLHLCNTAIALMVFAFVFKLHGVFYFTYFVNIMGALCALLLPTTGGPFTNMGNLSFFYNHVYAIILPFMGVSLGVFERPNIKLMKRAILFFTFYVFVAAVMDAWLNNSASLNNVNVAYGQPGHIDIDYFFLYSDFFINKKIFHWGYALKYTPKYILQFQLGDTLMTFYWMYILVVFAIAVALMFALWGVYGVLYRVEDSHRELARRKKMMRVDLLQLKKEMNGRPLTEPLHPEGANMIKISHFTKTYSGSDRKAVSDLNLEIHEGEVFGFIGHNGAGKSTTIKSLVGIQTITEGTIEIQGYDIQRQPLEAKLNIGYVSDNHAVYEKLTGREYVSYVADLYMVSEEDKQKRIEHYADLFGLTPAMDKEIKSYSHGMKQKLMVISALIHDPKVWILDEPLTGLDPTSAYQIKECMRAHADAGNIVFFSSHVIEVVEKICDRVAIISGGKLRRVCTAAELNASGESLEDLYLQYATEQKDEAAPAGSESTADANSGVETAEQGAAPAASAADETNGASAEAAAATDRKEGDDE